MGYGHTSSLQNMHMWSENFDLDIFFHKNLTFLHFSLLICKSSKFKPNFHCQIKFSLFSILIFFKIQTIDYKQKNAFPYTFAPPPKCTRIILLSSSSLLNSSFRSPLKRPFSHLVSISSPLCFFILFVI